MLYEVVVWNVVKDYNLYLWLEPIEACKKWYVNLTNIPSSTGSMCATYQTCGVQFTCLLTVDWKWQWLVLLFGARIWICLVNTSSKFECHLMLMCTAAAGVASLFSWSWLIQHCWLFNSRTSQPKTIPAELAVCLKTQNKSKVWVCKAFKNVILNVFLK